MKTALFFTLGLLFLGSGKSLIVEWQTPTEYDFGTLSRNEAVSYGFEFRNISDEAIVIENVRYTCGCTAPDWPETPIAPDSVATVNIQYKWHKTGYFRKKIKVYVTGQRKAEVLYVEGEVVD